MDKSHKVEGLVLASVATHNRDYTYEETPHVSLHSPYDGTYDWCKSLNNLLGKDGIGTWSRCLHHQSVYKRDRGLIAINIWLVKQIRILHHNQSRDGHLAIPDRQISNPRNGQTIYCTHGIWIFHSSLTLSRVMSDCHINHALPKLAALWACQAQALPHSDT